MKRTRFIHILFLFGILSSGFMSCSSNEDGGGIKPIPTEPDSGLPQQLTDEELMDKVQEQTFKYFWDFGHSVSGMARERSDDILSLSLSLSL